MNNGVMMSEIDIRIEIEKALKLMEKEKKFGKVIICYESGSVTLIQTEISQRINKVKERNCDNRIL